jgi:peptidoglycan/LPS O-acetylase OafA/YrhL
MSNRLAGVDILRGLAAMLVVVHHVHIRFRINGYQVEPFLPDSVGRVVLWMGYYSVVCFFVISGFLITRLSLRRWGSLDQISPVAFYGLRAARIMPLLVLVLAVLSVLHLLGVGPFVISPERATLGRALLAALGFHVNWYESKYGYLSGAWDVMWSLSVEETFYLLFPLACLTLRRPVALFVGMLPIVIIAPFYRVWVQDLTPWDEYAYLACMDGIALGCLAGWLSERKPLNTAHGRIAMAAGVAAALFIILFRKTAFDMGFVATGTYITVLEVGMALMLWAMASGTGNAFFSRGTSLLQAIGRCSYEIYLTHMFVVFASFGVFRAVFGKAAPQAVYPVSYVIMLVLAVLLGHLVSRWFSEPANRALRAWFASRVRADAQAAVRVSA